MGQLRRFIWSVCFLTMTLPETVLAIDVVPGEVQLLGPDARFQLISTITEQQMERDLTRSAEYVSQNESICLVSSTGVVTAVGDGMTVVEVLWNGSTQHIPVSVSGTNVLPRFHFERDIIPILSRYGCNSSGCHGKAEGQNGFKLSVFGFDPVADYAALLYETRGRRIALPRPDESLLLTKASGQSPHGGGVRIPPTKPEYRILRNWIAAGAPFGNADDSQLVSIEVFPRQRVLTKGAQQQLSVVGIYSDGRKIDVSHLAKFQSNNEGLVTISSDGFIEVGQTAGDVAVMAELMGQVDVIRLLVPQQKSFEAEYPVSNNFIDEQVHRKLEQLHIFPSEICHDSDFQRRAALDITGRLPTIAEAKAFQQSRSDNKRQQWVDMLLESPEYADFWALTWSDLLRVNRDKLGHRGAYEYYRWIRESFRDNKPMDQFARELLTATGNLSDHPAGHLYRAVSNPGDAASTISQVLLGVRIECAQCHHHPFDQWSQTDYAGMQAFFVQPIVKSTPHGELLYCSEKPATARHPRTNEEIPAYALGEHRPEAPPTGDARLELANWMTRPNNRWFARNIVNRVWAHFLGRGLIEPVDDVRLTNPPSNPELLEKLTEHFIQHQFDLHNLIRTITASRTYQLSVTANSSNQADNQNFSRATLRPLSAEVLLDAICDVTGVPEKFAGIPANVRAVQLWDSHVFNEFLKTFGRPVRVTPCECERVSEPNLSQVLKVMNSPRLQEKLAHESGRVALWSRTLSDNVTLIDEMMLMYFSRLPTREERMAALQFLDEHQENRRRAIEDLAWSLMNTTEFLFNH